MAVTSGSISDNPYLQGLITGGASNAGGSTAAKPASNELGKTAFLDLMVAQLKNQSPLNPAENTEFVAQLAQFSSVESLDNLNTKFDTFANDFQSNQALQASSLVGRTVTVPGTKAELPVNGVVSGVVKMDQASSDLEMSIFSATGALVDKVPMGDLPAGNHNFRWNGQQLEVNGSLLDWTSSQDSVLPGDFTFAIQGTTAGKSTQFDTSLSASVSSVTMGAGNELTLNLKGAGSVKFSDVEQINQ